MFAALLTFSYYLGTAPFSADAWLERRIGWWHWIAEVGHHQRATTAAADQSLAARAPVVADVTAS